MENRRSPFLYDICVLRALAITIVVAFHAYGMMYAEAHFPNTIGLYKNAYFILNQCVLINIAMPLFVFISGFLFNKDKYATLFTLLKDKGQRLLLPYFFFGIIMMLTTNSFDLNTLFKGGFWHLWFLPMLLWCFVLSWIINQLHLRTNKYVNCLCLVFFGYLITFDKFLPPFIGLYQITKWYYWFFLGWMVREYKDTISLYLKKKCIVFPLLVGSIFILCYSPTEYGYDTWYSIVAVTLIVLSLWKLFREIPWKKLKGIDFIIKYSALSFGIYIYHNWIELYLISSTAKRLLPLEDWVHNIYIFPLLFFLLSLVLSGILTKLTLSTKVGRFLIK